MRQENFKIQYPRNKLCRKKNKEWRFIKHSFNINFSIDSKNKLIFDYNNFFNSKIDYAITLDHKLKLGIGHTVITNEAPLLISAGRIIVNNFGYMIYIDNKSGHYSPRIHNMIWAIDYFKSLKINMDYCAGIVFDREMNIIDYINKEPKNFAPSTQDINFATIKPKLNIEIPDNFNWLIYKTQNELDFLITEQDCINHYKNIGYLLSCKIAENNKYIPN